MENRKLAVITTGGTAEPIDDVRYVNVSSTDHPDAVAVETLSGYVTNFSTGKFGYEIAKSLADLGYEVESLTARASMWLPDHPSVTKIPFTSAKSLRASILSRQKPAIIMMAAAVSDYTPIPVTGKISSNKDELTITMTRTPKILAELRERFGRDTFIVGFKLLSGVSRAELVRVAQKQLTDNHLDLVVANDLARLHSGQHPLIVITPEGGAIDFSGTREQVARELAEFVHKRAVAQHALSYPAHPTKRDLDQERVSRQRYAEVLHTAHELNLFTDKSGHVSVPGYSDRTIIVSPRQVDKSTMTVDDAVLTKVNGDIVLYHGDQKPSTDTSILGALYDSLQLGKSAYIHFHNGWGRMSYQTSFPYPCGTREEFLEILRAFSGPDRLRRIVDFSVELVHHGFLIGINDSTHLSRLKETWRIIHRDFVEHAKESLAKDGKAYADALFHHGKFRPIWDGNKIAGLIYDDPTAATVYLTPDARGKGLGKTVVSQLISRNYTVRTLEYCGVADFYQKLGFTPSVGADSLMRLTPPQL